MASLPDANAIAAALGGEARGNRIAVPSPGHSKRDRGTVMTVDPGAPDGLLVHSFNGTDPLAIKDDLRRRGLLPERPEWRERPAMRFGPDAHASDTWEQTGVYEYDDGAGSVIYRTRRLECPGKGKRFVAERQVDGRWVSGLGDVVRLPYRFTELCRAAERSRDTGEPEPLIYFVEGERKADKLAGWGLLATAIAFGANGWREEYGQAFSGSTVVILPDNDELGRKFAETVKAGIKEYGGTVHILELPDLPTKGDIIDWSGTAEDLRELTARTLAGTILPLPTLDLVALAVVQPTAKQFAIERLAPLAEVTLFTGPGSAGKSLLGQQLATAAAAGLSCLGLVVAGCPAVYLTCEDDAGQLHWRQEHLCRALGVGMADLAGRLHLVSLRGALDNDLGTFAADGTFSPSPAYHRLVRMVLATGSKLVCLDNVAHLFTGNENDRGEVTRFVNLLNRLAGETGAAILLLGHPNKSGDSYSGSTAWLNAVRSQFTIDHDRDSNGDAFDLDARVVTVGKANYAQKGEAVRFRWHEWAFVLEAELSNDIRGEIADVAKANGDNSLFIACLAERTRQRRAVSEKHSATFAPSIFATMPESKRVGKKRLQDAMDRLFRIGKIERAELWKGEDRKAVFGLRETTESCGQHTVRETRETVPEAAENRAGNAGTTHTYTTYTSGAAPSGSPAPDGRD